MRDFQADAVGSLSVSRSRTLVNVSTGGGKTIALLFPLVCDAVRCASLNSPRSLSLCFTPLLALQADHVAKLRGNVVLGEVLQVLSLADEKDAKLLKDVLGVLSTLTRSVLVFLNPERFSSLAEQLCARASLVSYVLFDEVHTYIDWMDFRVGFEALRGIAARLRDASVAAASATVTWTTLTAFSEFIGVDQTDWKIVRQITRRENHFYHVFEERTVLRHVPVIFSRDRMPLLVVVNSISAMVTLRKKVLAWTGLEPGSVLVYASGFSDEHKEYVDGRFRRADRPHVVMVATAAYALGIDANIASVVLFGVPRTMAAFVQAVGRAGRRGAALAHCSIVIDSVGLRNTDEQLKSALGEHRPRPKRQSNSASQAQCCSCLRWCHLASGAKVPGDDDTFFCGDADQVCQNVSRLPACMHVMIERFLNMSKGRLDVPQEASVEGRCGSACGDRCDFCVRPPPPSVPSLSSFVKVISSGSVYFERVGQVILVSEDSTFAHINFGGYDWEVNLPCSILVECSPVILMANTKPAHLAGPLVLRTKLEKFFSDFETGLPRGSLVCGGGIQDLVSKRPVSSEDIVSCFDSVHPCCAVGVAAVIKQNQEEKQGKRTGARKANRRNCSDTQEREESDSDEAELFVSGSQSLQGRIRKKSQK